MNFTVACLALSGDRASGDLAVMKERLGEVYTIVAEHVLSNDASLLQAELIDLCDRGVADLIITTGGIGVAPGDRTPQSTAAILDYEITGIAEAIRARAIRGNPNAMLVRVLAGVRHRTLILNLPAGAAAVGDSLDVVLPILPNALEYVTGR